MTRTLLTWLLLVLVVALLWGAPKLRTRRPAAWWLLLGFPRSALRAVFTWRKLTVLRGLAVPKKPAHLLMGGLILRGQALRTIPPRLALPRLLRGGWSGAPGMTARVRLHPGQTPDQFRDASEAIAHAWRMHTVRVTSPDCGHVLLTCLPIDPLAAVEPAELPPAKPDPAELLRARVGRRDDGAPWLVDFKQVPHWLVVGATQSGKSTWMAALVSAIAPQPVALVGIDCKGGMELSLFEPRLSALATDRPGAVRLLAALVEMAQERMTTCRLHSARSIWELPDNVRPVPVVLLVDELAELFLAATTEEKKEAGQASTYLVRYAQLGRALGMHLVAAGQRVGSDLGPGATALRAQLGGRACHRVSDPGTAEMALGDLNPDAVDAAQAITPGEAGIAVTVDEGTWLRARSAYVTAGRAAHVAAQYEHVTPRLPELLSALAAPGPAPTRKG